MLASCQEGHLDVAMLLSSYGARRDNKGSEAVDLAEEGDHHELARWLRASTNYPPLHHVRVLSRTRAYSLLRSGASPVARHGGTSAAELARALPASAAAQLIVRAAPRWSPSTHELWGPRARARAAALLQIGYQLSRQRFVGSEGGWVDVWLYAVMPHAVTRDADDDAIAAAQAPPSPVDLTAAEAPGLAPGLTR